MLTTKVFPKALLVIASLSATSVWATECKDLFGNRRVLFGQEETIDRRSPSYRSPSDRLLVDEQAELIHEFESLRLGVLAPANFMPTPANRVVVMGVKSATSWSLYEGRIISVIAGANGIPDILFLRRDYNGGYHGTPVKVSLATVDMQSVRIQKVLSPHEEEQIVGRFTYALQTDQLVSFTNQYGRHEEQRGRIRGLGRDQAGRISTFVLADDDGSEVSRSINSVDPVSIKFMKVQPRQLSPIEATLAGHLQEAISARKFVSFQAKSQYGSGLAKFEGWVTEVELNSSGEYLFRVDPNKCETKCGEHKYKLKDIVPNTFDGRPTLLVREGGEIHSGGRAAAQLTAYVESTRGERQVVAISPTLYSELSVFADGTQASGSRLPYELEDHLAPGSEMRLYFANGDRRIRLTIRRARDGSWRFADTSFDRRNVNESYSDDFTHSRYTINEASRLTEDSHYGSGLPAAGLRTHLHFIRAAMAEELVDQEFHHIKSQWAESIPEDANNSEVLDLLLHEQGLHYYLNRGFVRENLTPLNEDQKMKLSAIKYLVANKLVFYSYNAGASGINMGIYPRGSVKPGSMWLTGYDFGRSLLESMKNAGLQYANGQWVKK